MKKRSKKLVPLMPILVRMRACPDARKWLRHHDFATFADAWNACPESHWLVWIVGKALDCEAGRDVAVADCDIPTGIAWDDIEARMGRVASIGTHHEEALALVRERFDRAFVERALYDYAVREGLA